MQQKVKANGVLGFCLITANNFKNSFNKEINDYLFLIFINFRFARLINMKFFYI